MTSSENVARPAEENLHLKVAMDTLDLARKDERDPDGAPCELSPDEATAVWQQMHLALAACRLLIEDGVECECRKVAVCARCAAQAALNKSCEPYLKDAETASECIERNRKDVIAAMQLLAAEKRKTERIANCARKVHDGDSSYQGALIEIEAICNV